MDHEDAHAALGHGFEVGRLHEVEGDWLTGVDEAQGHSIGGHLCFNFDHAVELAAVAVEHDVVEGLSERGHQFVAEIAVCMGDLPHERGDEIDGDGAVDERGGELQRDVGHVRGDTSATRARLGTVRHATHQRPRDSSMTSGVFTMIQASRRT